MRQDVIEIHVTNKKEEREPSENNEAGISVSATEIGSTIENALFGL